MRIDTEAEIETAVKKITQQEADFIVRYQTKLEEYNEEMRKDNDLFYMQMNVNSSTLMLLETILEINHKL